VFVGHTSFLNSVVVVVVGTLRGATSLIFLLSLALSASVASAGGAPPALCPAPSASPKHAESRIVPPLLRSGSRSKPLAEPVISARAAAVLDSETGRVLYAKEAHARRAPASTTKIMTALLAVEALPLDAPVVTSTDARDMAGSSLMGIIPGLSLTTRDLLYGLMLPSGNDAAIELARAVSGSESAFVAGMNTRASQMGIKDTHFENPHGLDEPGHLSSAYDLAVIAREAMHNASFRDLAAAAWYDVPSAPGWGFANGNSLLASYPGADGVKIGWTDEAGWTFVASAERDGHRVIVALLDTPERDSDATLLLDWAFAVRTSAAQSSGTPKADSSRWRALTRPVVALQGPSSRCLN
jgi:D-alanyl-D-alanine carboxypeptidase